MKRGHMTVEHLRVNHLENPLGYDFSYLTFSWKILTEREACPYKVRVIVFLKESMDCPVYDSGEFENYKYCQIGASLLLKPKTRYFWKVMVKCAKEEWVESKTAWFETAKMEEKWNACWITAPEDREHMPVLYKDFTIQGKLSEARLYFFGAGLYEIEVNQEKAGDEYLLPGYHSYDLLQEYQTFDLTGLLQEGENRISVLLGEGWYKGRFGFDDEYYDLYGDRKKCIGELFLTYEDGRKEHIFTDGTWQAFRSCIGTNGIYDGEVQDDTIEPVWLPVSVLDESTDLLEARTSPPIRKVQEFLPISETGEGESLVLDFGESITGWVEFCGTLKKGQKIRLQYGEVLQEGKFYRDNLRTARAEFVYISDGREKTVRPHFTYYGFRYVKVEGIEKVQKLRFKAYRIMSDLEQTGTIQTSNEKVNQLFENTIRSQKCNFLDIPTDCPQRDERMGWTGDANIFARTACFHMDSAAFFRHYTKSLYKEQKLLNGAVPFFVPRPKVPVRENTNPFYLDSGVCVWGDAAVMLPWMLFQYYGDYSLLKEQYPMMKAWVEYVSGRVKENAVPYLWQNDRQLGDWLALDNGDLNNPVGKTDTSLLASACYYWSALTLAKAGEALKLSEAEKYEKLAKKIKEAFFQFYFESDGELKTEATQTAFAFLLFIGLYPEKGKEKLIENLREKIKENKGHLNTGFAGTPVLCPALSENGLNETAYDLLLNEEYPGWLYEVNLGATTVWERWNSLGEDGKISGTGMNSLNHYAYGSIADWMYRYMCGFMPDMQAGVPMLIRPLPDKRFSYVKGSWDSVYGTYESEWIYQEERGFEYKIKIPFPASARVVFPNGKSHILKCGSYCFDNNGECL